MEVMGEEMTVAEVREGGRNKYMERGGCVICVCDGGLSLMLYVA